MVTLVSDEQVKPAGTDSWLRLVTTVTPVGNALINCRYAAVSIWRRGWVDERAGTLIAHSPFSERNTSTVDGPKIVRSSLLSL
jgi:hypothetical protein